MQSEKQLHIDLSKASQQSQTINFQVCDEFFNDLQQEEIEGGQVDVSLTVKPSANNIYNINIHVKGFVEVLCDRCLELLQIPIEVDDTIKVKDGLEEDFDADDIKYTEGRTSEYNLDWDVYEIIETSLPIQRVHPIDQCNQDVVQRIISDEQNGF